MQKSTLDFSYWLAPLVTDCSRTMYSAYQSGHFLVVLPAPLPLVLPTHDPDPTKSGRKAGD